MALREASDLHPRLTWQLSSKSGSQPTRGFVYGDAVDGMQAVGAREAGTLKPGIGYRLEVEAGRARGSVNFTPQAAGEPR